MSVKPGLKLYYKVVSKPEYYSGNSKTGIYVTADDVEGWLHDMYLKGWEFISYGQVNWVARDSDSFWIFKRRESHD